MFSTYCVWPFQRQSDGILSSSKCGPMLQRAQRMKAYIRAIAALSQPSCSIISGEGAFPAPAVDAGSVIAWPGLGAGAEAGAVVGAGPGLVCSGAGAPAAAAAARGLNWTPRSWDLSGLEGQGREGSARGAI